MIFLFLAILASSSIAIIFKVSETSGMNRFVVTTTNYATAILVSLILLLISGIGIPNQFEGSGGELIGIFSGSSNELSRETSFLWALLVGLTGGVFFFLSFLFYQISVKEHGMSLAGTFGKVGILLPVVLSLVIWREFPSSIQWIGMALASLAIILVAIPTKSESGKFTFRMKLILLFLFGGLAEFSNKAFQQYAIPEDKPVFLFCIFSMAFIWSLAVTIKENSPWQKKSILTGILVGVPNLLSSFFLIMALESGLPAAVVFPVFGAGSIVLINLVGAFFFKEKLSVVEKIAVGLTILAIVLITINS